MQSATDAQDFSPEALSIDRLRDEFDREPNRLVLDWAVRQAEQRGALVLFAQIAALPGGEPCLRADDASGASYRLALPSKDAAAARQGLIALQEQLAKPIAVFPHGVLVEYLRELDGLKQIALCPQAYRPPIFRSSLPSQSSQSRRGLAIPSPHLARLEAESIHIIREAIAEARNPVMLYSVGKDSGVMLHLARKAFFPSPPPFPLLHVDTRWKFQEMYSFRDFMVRASGMELLVHVNPECVERDINPFDHGSAVHTDLTKTEGLKQALNKHSFDVIFGGARRDEEKSRAKERIFSFRTATHQWNPKSQRPEVWNLYNTRKNPGESIRVFPLSNWTELDIWQYIHQEDIPVVPLYFARPRAVVVRPEMIMMVDDERCRLTAEDEIQILKVRFRTLGCYPLSGAMESDAQSIEDILLELVGARQSERQGRRIDTDGAGSMERKKQEGYF